MKSLFYKKILIAYSNTCRNEDDDNELLFLCRAVSKNDDVASVNMCNMYVAQHSKPSLSTYESLFFVRFSFFSFFFFVRRVSTIPNVVIYICIYLINVFVFFPFTFSTKKKKSETYYISLLLLDSSDAS